MLSDRHQEIFDDPATPVGGNPQGDVTIVEFFDYRCPYCKQVQPSLETLLDQDPKLRFVYKEMPVLGPSSVVAAHAALAARLQGKYDAFHNAMMAAKGQITDEVVYHVAGSVGLDVERLKRDMASPEVDQAVKANLALAEALDIRGTPGFHHRQPHRPRGHRSRHTEGSDRRSPARDSDAQRFRNRAAYSGWAAAKGSSFMQLSKIRVIVG